jgi:hypothetical protein
LTTTWVAGWTRGDQHRKRSDNSAGWRCQRRGRWARRPQTTQLCIKEERSLYEGRLVHIAKTTCIGVVRETEASARFSAPGSVVKCRPNRDDAASHLACHGHANDHNHRRRPLPSWRANHLELRRVGCQQVVSTRFVKRQQMAWRPAHTQGLLQVRTAVLMSSCEHASSNGIRRSRATSTLTISRHRAPALARSP